MLLLWDITNLSVMSSMASAVMRRGRLDDCRHEDETQETGRMNDLTTDGWALSLPCRSLNHR